VEISGLIGLRISEKQMMTETQLFERVCRIIDPTDPRMAERRAASLAAVAAYYEEKRPELFKKGPS
jgi:hypothetical protein